MSPDELRAAADRTAGGSSWGDYQTEQADNELLEQAARRLADVIEYTEDMYGGGGMAEYMVDVDAGEVWRIARGDATNETRSE